TLAASATGAGFEVSRRAFFDPFDFFAPFDPFTLRQV
ncbi:MAG: hypothetical protein JWN70_399, partial [Planctomycetaceae bacterium]|nr:hypothetical protein [Planctomycetaceae bacterium]